MRLVPTECIIHWLSDSQASVYSLAGLHSVFSGTPGFTECFPVENVFVLARKSLLFTLVFTLF